MRGWIIQYMESLITFWTSKPALESFQINFSEDQMRLMNLCLAFLMFGVALDMKLADFKRIALFPKSVITGLVSQWIILPLMTIYLIHLWGPVPGVALGLLLVASCPGGNLSNYATHLSKGNAALSVTLTSIVTALSFIITPLAFAGYGKFIPQVAPLMEQIELSPIKMLGILVQLILLPMIAGMAFNYIWPDFTRKIRKPVSRLSLIIFIGFIVAAIHGDFDNLVKYIHYVFALVVVHNLLAMITGYYWARWNRLPVADCRAISLETGIQNSGLGMILIFNFFPNFGSMMLVTAFWAIWDLVSSFLIALYWSRRPLKDSTAGS